MSLSARGSIDQGDLALSFAHLMRDDLTCGVLVFDRHHHLISASPNVAAMLGVTTEPTLEAVAAHLPGHVWTLVEKAALKGRPVSETEILERSGRNQSLRLTVLPLLQGAEARGITAILVQDLCFASRLEEDIRQLDRLASVGTLAAEMAHEVRNALVAVKTFVDLLLEKNPEAELAETVRREMKRIDAIVAQVLKYSRNATPAFQPTSIHALIERTLQMLKPRLAGRNITVTHRLEAAPDLVHGDEGHLEQALLNLLLNAAEAMNGEGTLSLETDLLTDTAGHAGQSVSPRQVRIIIRDTGAGIPTEHMTHLFEPFFTTKRNGTGLGLAITRRIIHEHHGLISAESTPGQGSTFHLLLPAA